MQRPRFRILRPGKKRNSKVMIFFFFSSKKQKMLGCTFLLEISVACAFSLSNVCLCLYSHRLHNWFRPHGKRYAALAATNFIGSGTALGVYTASACKNHFLVWGGITFSLALALMLVETCVYCTHDDETPVARAHRCCESASSPSIDQAVRQGIVLTIGSRAATISEKDTQRQFYASFSSWTSELRPGESVSFRVEPSFAISGRHRVGSKTYDRYHCEPAGTKLHSIAVNEKKDRTDDVVL